MALRIGIVGLPNVGKSTALNALTGAQNAMVANYPFCTIQPNRAVVPVPDHRVGHLSKLAGLNRSVPATIEFIDIAGLVKGASKGEGLGNQFLGNIRDVDAVVHLVRCFHDPNVVHVHEAPNPRHDVEIVNLELILADLQQLERKIERLVRQIKGNKALQSVVARAEALKNHLEEGHPVSTYLDKDEPFLALDQELRFLSGKPVIYAANVDENQLDGKSECVRQAETVAAEYGAESVALCAKFEEEMIGMANEDKRELLEMAGATESGLAQVIAKSYRLLNLISFFSMNEEETRAWTIQDGWTAPQAAGVIHTDFQKGFIRAEVIPYETFIEYGSSTGAKAAGAMRIEGKEYVVSDGDVIYFRFNV
jgi:GTP-binding protein YchF